MIQLRTLLVESYSNWVVPNKKQLELEYHVEHELKNNDFFDSLEDFLHACESGKFVTITPSMDAKIQYRSRTKSKSDLLSLIRGYRSYPQFRNEKTVENIYNAFKENRPMDMPIVIQFKDGSQRIFAGNTRMDIAFQLGINPKVLMIKSSRK